MPNRINPSNLDSIRHIRQDGSETTPKTDRRFQAFVDEALKENQHIEHVEHEKTRSSINISNHALKRMSQREIKLSETDLKKLEEAFSTLDSKGAENSLIIYDDLSLIASIKNRTIITASKSEEMREVTNIDSAILVQK